MTKAVAKQTSLAALRPPSPTFNLISKSLEENSFLKLDELSPKEPQVVRYSDRLDETVKQTTPVKKHSLYAKAGGESPIYRVTGSSKKSALDITDIAIMAAIVASLAILVHLYARGEITSLGDRLAGRPTRGVSHTTFAELWSNVTSPLASLCNPAFEVIQNVLSPPQPPPPRRTKVFGIF